MTDKQFKHSLSKMILWATVGWAVFCAILTYRAIESQGVADIIGSAGANVLLGAMLNWTGNVVQYWFRKKSKESKEDDK